MFITLRSPLFRHAARLVRYNSTTSSTVAPQDSVNKNVVPEKERGKKPIKFTTSDAHVNYRSTLNFRWDEDHSLPKTHNLFLAVSFISGFFYLIFLRDDVDNDGGVNLFKPVYETVPHIAIPLLESNIAERKKAGLAVRDLEAKLREFKKEPEKYGGYRKKLVEN